LKNFFAVIWAFSVLTVQFSEGLIFLSFKINQDFIAKNLCVEKDVEGSTCKGCCQLKKKLNENKEQKEQLPPQLFNKYDFNLYSCSTGNFRFQSSEKGINMKGYSNCYYFSFSYSVFHPPKVVMFI